ncbi:TetR/AcrR family transcriptional regulator [Arcanobacterium ihumii]|uniref:TetR/AcrR family transcriptional regulator n=1 Tax=Arcanobacterium ihumii TaxID=2138162 RepID=UPI000F535BDA|nr:TetR/AcrR family transcriptional regulator [Arcanobacterium ihumii]
MGRNRSFNLTEVLHSSAALFRSKGYEASSIDDVVKVTGVHRGSLYNTFGSKYGLFLKVLDNALESLDQPENIELLLVALFDAAPNDPTVQNLIEPAIKTHTSIATTLGLALLSRAGLDQTEPQANSSSPRETETSSIDKASDGVHSDTFTQTGVEEK